MEKIEGIPETSSNQRLPVIEDYYFVLVGRKIGIDSLLYARKK